MTNLQGGITSSQLTPQAYKNSSQNSSFQDTFNSQNTSVSNNQSLLFTAPATRTLRVDTGRNTSVLSASSSSTAQNQAVVGPSNNYVPVALAVLIVSVGMMLYFFKMYKSLETVRVESEESSAEQ